MSTMYAFSVRFLLRSALAAMTLAGLSACGGGDGPGGTIGVGVVVPVQPPVVAPLGLTLTRVGPEAIALDWSDDPYVATFSVVRDGNAFASVNGTSLIDASVYLNYRYCYQVQGYDATGRLTAASGIGCITVVP